MLRFRFMLCAFLALQFLKYCDGSGTKTIKLASLTKGVWKVCLQIDSANVAPAKIPLDIGGFIHISNIKTFQQNCDDFHLSKQVDDFLIVIPDRVGSSCYHFSDCHATILMRNDKVTLGNSKCYNLFQGHYWHDQGVDSVKEFRVTNFVPRGLTCNLNSIDTLIRSKNLKAVGDIFSPIEDLFNQAIDQFKTLGNQFTTTITDQFNVLASTVTDQVNQVVLVVQQETFNVTTTVVANYHVVAVKLDEIGTFIKKDAGVLDRYFHIFLHVIEILGTIWLIQIIYKLYKRANGIYDVFHWIWARINPRHHQQQQLQMQQMQQQQQPQQQPQQQQQHQPR